jgi:tRNA (guanosine-2'-O-)-methyltransferase
MAQKGTDGFLSVFIRVICEPIFFSQMTLKGTDIFLSVFIRVICEPFFSHRWHRKAQMERDRYTFELKFRGKMTPERRDKIISVLEKRQDNLTIVLENVFDPHNEAAVMRTCDSVGIQDIYIINNRIPPKKKWGFKSGSSAKKWMTIHQFTNAADCFKELRNQYDKILTTHLASDAVNVYDIDFTESIALVFGNERFGVSDETRELADGNFVIPQCGIIQSLNISVACAVTVYEAYRQKEKAGHYRQPTLSIGRRNHLLNEWGLKEQDIFSEEEN